MVSTASVGVGSRGGGNNGGPPDVTDPVEIDLSGTIVCGGGWRGGEEIVIVVSECSGVVLAGLEAGIVFNAAARSSTENTSCRRHTSNTFSSTASPLESPPTAGLINSGTTDGRWCSTAAHNSVLCFLEPYCNGKTGM